SAAPPSPLVRRADFAKLSARGQNTGASTGPTASESAVGGRAASDVLAGQARATVGAKLGESLIIGGRTYPHQRWCWGSALHPAFGATPRSDRLPAFSGADLCPATVARSMLLICGVAGGSRASCTGLVGGEARRT